MTEQASVTFEGDAGPMTALTFTQAGTTTRFVRSA
jgi:hypothetical protein